MRRVTNIRKYQDKKISEHDLELLYEAFSLGFSSVSNQARELLVIEEMSTREAMVRSTLNPYMTPDSVGAQSWLINSPFVAVVLIEQRRAIARVGEIGVVIAEREAESALQNVRLQAVNREIGTTVIREFDQEILTEQLALPWYVKPTAILTAGYLDEEKDPSPRLPIDQVINKERWQ